MFDEKREALQIFSLLLAHISEAVTHRDKYYEVFIYDLPSS